MTDQQLVDLGDGRRIPMATVVTLNARRLDHLEDVLGMTLAEIEDVLTGVTTAEDPDAYVLTRTYRHCFGAVLWASMLAAGVTDADYWTALEDIPVLNAIQESFTLWAGDEEEVDPTQAGGEPAPEQPDSPSPSTDSDSATT